MDSGTMSQNQQKGEDQTIRDFMVNDLKRTQDLQEKISDKIFDLAIKNTLYRRDYYAHITTLVVAILGFSVVMYGRDGALTNYLTVGIILFLVLIILLLSHLREVLDEDQKGLDKQHEEYQEILEVKKDIYFKYLSNSLTPDNFQLCQKELRESPKVVEFGKAFQKFEEQRKLRFEKLNYLGEFIILVFVTGVFFILISIANVPLKWYELIFILLVLTVVSFSNISQYVANLINKIIYFILKLKKMIIQLK